MVDRGLRIRRLTAASAKVLKIVPSDMGRPISDIRWDVDVPNLDDLIASVIETLAPKELEVQAKDGQWYSLQIRPYRTTDDKIDGAVIVLSDINEAKQTSERIEKAKLFMEEALATVREPLLVLTQNLSVIYANPSFTKTLHVRVEQIEKKVSLPVGRWTVGHSQAARKARRGPIQRSAGDRFRGRARLPELGKKDDAPQCPENRRWAQR